LEIAMALDATTEEKPTEKPTNVAGDRLRSIVDRIERLEEERKALGSDIKDIYSEAKSAGFDIKVLRQLIRIRKQEPAEIEEQETLLDVRHQGRRMTALRVIKRCRRSAAQSSNGPFSIDFSAAARSPVRHRQAAT
jgi:uncharacterized protein (UPF0335 family)